MRFSSLCNLCVVAVFGISLLSCSSNGTTKNSAESKLKRYASQINARQLKLVHKAAKQDDVRAQDVLSVFYQLGIGGVVKDHDKAAYWRNKVKLSKAKKNVVKTSPKAENYADQLNQLHKSAEQGYRDAQVSLGKAYSRGQGVPKNYDKAVYWYRKAAELGDTLAIKILGSFYLQGRRGFSKDYAKAIHWYSKAAEQGDADAQHSLGTMYARGLGVSQDYAKAAHWYGKAGEQGFNNIQTHLAKWYKTGRPGLPKDETKAEYWYRKAAYWTQKSAEQGLRNAQVSLGHAYYKGQGVPQDNVKAVYWYRKAADQGDDSSQNNLGAIYAAGLQGVAQDYGQAFFWYRKTAEQGYANAQIYLATAYYKGLGVPKDYVSSAHWYSKAAEQGDAKAQYLLGLMYIKGRGVPQDYAKAAHLLHKVVEVGDGAAKVFFGEAFARAKTSARIELGKIYTKGSEGIPQDYAKAVRLFREAAEQGSAVAQYYLGHQYVSGHGVPQDNSQAMHWYQKAAKQGGAKVLNLFRTAAKQGDIQAKEVIKSTPNNPLQTILLETLAKALTGVAKTVGDDKINRYIEELGAGNAKAAATLLTYPTSISSIEKENKLTGLVSDIKDIHTKLGDFTKSKSTDFPTGKYQLFTISMIPEKDHPEMAGTITVPVTFTKAGAGAINFMTGEINGKQGLYEVQYMCFSCATQLKEKETNLSRSQNKESLTNSSRKLNYTAIIQEASDQYLDLNNISSRYKTEKELRFALKVSELYGPKNQAVLKYYYYSYAHKKNIVPLYQSNIRCLGRFFQYPNEIVKTNLIV